MAGCSKFGNKVRSISDLDTSLPSGRVIHGDDAASGGDVDVEVLGGDGVDGLLLGLHDVGQGGVAGLVEAEVRGDHQREGSGDVFHAAVDLALDHGPGLVGVDHQLAGESGLAPHQEPGGQL